jgi:hypothetical protein
MRFGNPLKKTRIVDTKVGHSIEFPGRDAVAAKGYKVPEHAVLRDGIVYVHVPPVAVQDVVAANMEPESEIPEQDEPTTPQRPADPNAVREQLFDAFEKIVAGGAREDFAASGTPTPAAVSKILGWTVQNAEVKDMWKQFQAVGTD